MQCSSVINQSAAVEQSIAAERNANRATIESGWKDTKIPGFFESYGLSFKLSFPKVNLFQQMKATGNTITNSFFKVGTAISSFSLRDAISKGISFSFGKSGADYTQDVKKAFGNGEFYKG